jgi:hypothetical protein
VLLDNGTGEAGTRQGDRGVPVERSGRRGDGWHFAREGLRAGRLGVGEPLGCDGSNIKREFDCDGFDQAAADQDVERFPTLVDFDTGDAACPAIGEAYLASKSEWNGQISYFSYPPEASFVWSGL